MLAYFSNKRLFLLLSGRYAYYSFPFIVLANARLLDQMSLTFIPHYVKQKFLLVM